MRINLNQIFEKTFHYLFAIAIILNTRSIWTSVEGMDWFNSFLLAFLGISLLGCLMFTKIRKKSFFNCFIVVVAITIYLLLFWTIDQYRTNSFIRQIFTLDVVIVYCGLFGNRTNYKKLPKGTMPFWNCYENLILVVACVSLFFWLTGSILDYVQPTGYVYSSWTGAGDYYKRVASYFGLYFETQTGLSSLLGVPYRNSAIFTEAPMASLHFSMALLIELFLREKNSKVKIAILSIAIMSTVATTGYLIMILAFFAKLFFKEERKSIKIILKYVFVIGFFLIALYMLQFLLAEKMGSESGSIRLDDFSAGFQAWLDSPIIGNGYGNYDAVKKYMSSFRSYNMGYSNSPMNILAVGGLYLFVLYILPAISGIYKTITYKDWDSFTFYMLFLLIFAVTVVPFSALTYIMFVTMAVYGNRKYS